MQDGARHFDPEWSAGVLGNALGHTCDGSSALTVPKLLSVALFSCNLAEEYVRPIRYGLSQFNEDIDSTTETSPDAKSLADFMSISGLMAHQAKFHFDPIRQLLPCPVIVEACSAVSQTVGQFHSRVIRIVRAATSELVVKLFHGLEHHDWQTALGLLQWMPLEERKRQEGIVRLYLDQMQTEAGEAHRDIVRIHETIRRDSGNLRDHLRTAESICKGAGGMASEEVYEAFRAVLHKMMT
jgi:hypothetical protein